MVSMFSGITAMERLIANYQSLVAAFGPTYMYEHAKSMIVITDYLETKRMLTNKFAKCCYYHLFIVISRQQVAMTGPCQWCIRDSNWSWKNITRSIPNFHTWLLKFDVDLLPVLSQDIQNDQTTITHTNSRKVSWSCCFRSFTYQIHMFYEIREFRTEPKPFRNN